jgi:hypothetical protein
MNENEKNLFYSVLKDKMTEEPAPELVPNIMHIIHQKAQKKAEKTKVLEILGYVVLLLFAIGFVGGYLYYYSDFHLTSLKIGISATPRIYIIIMSVIFVFALIELYFRKRLYERN